MTDSDCVNSNSVYFQYQIRSELDLQKSVIQKPAL